MEKIKEMYTFFTHLQLQESLHIASLNNNLEIVRFLLKVGVIPKRITFLTVWGSEKMQEVSNTLLPYPDIISSELGKYELRRIRRIEIEKLNIFPQELIRGELYFNNFE